MDMRIKLGTMICMIHLASWMPLMASYGDGASSGEASGTVSATSTIGASTKGITSSDETLHNFPMGGLDILLAEVLLRHFGHYEGSLIANRYRDFIAVFLDNVHTNANNCFEEVFNSLQEYVFDASGGGSVLDVSETKHFLHLFGEVLIGHMNSLITITEMFKEDVGGETLKDLLRNFQKNNLDTVRTTHR